MVWNDAVSPRQKPCVNQSDNTCRPELAQLSQTDRSLFAGQLQGTTILPVSTGAPTLIPLNKATGRSTGAAVNALRPLTRFNDDHGDA